MRTPMLSLVLILPNALVLAVALNANAARPQQGASRQAPAIHRASQGRVAARRISDGSRPLFLAEAVRKEQRFVSLLMKREERAISDQRRSLRELGRLISRDLRVPGQTQQRLSATGGRIEALTRSIQLREKRILGRFFRIDSKLAWVKRFAPMAEGLRAFLERQDGLTRSIDGIERLQSSLGVDSLPDTPTFPIGKLPASPIQA